MSRRDVRDPVLVYCGSSGFRNSGFTVVPLSTIQLGAGHYVLIPVLNEQAGDAMLDELKQHVALKVQSDPELFVYGSGDATKIVQDALWRASDKDMGQPNHGRESSDQPAGES